MKKLTTMTTMTATAARKATAGVELMTGAALRALAVMTMVMLTTATAWAQKSEHWTGDGTAGEPYVISTEAGLRALSELSKDYDYYGKYFVLDDDITMSNEPMAPIGEGDYGFFSGHFNGQGHTISNLHISGKVVAYAGLFAMNDGEISGVTLAGCNVTGNEAGTRYTGGIVGYNGGGTVSGCHITGSSSVSSTGASEYLGGIVGNNDGTVSECTSAATVSATASNYNQYVGGIVGYINGGTVSGCGNTGGVAISGTGSAFYECGGIVGEIYSGKVSGCINTGAVSSSASGSNFAGGIVGNANNDASVTIENCANGGAVTASGGTMNCAGGIVGYYDESQYVLTNNFYFGDCTAAGVGNDDGSFDITDNNGAVRGYAVTAAEGVTGVTVVPAVSVATVEGGEAITSGQYYGTGTTVKLGDYTGAMAGGFNGYTAATAGGDIEVSCADGAYSFTMPAEAVTVEPAFMATMTGVSYIDEDGEAVTTPEGEHVWVLSGATTGLTHIGKEGAETWYVVTDSNTDGVDAAFTSVSFRGDVRLILADGAEMQVGTDDDGYNNMIGDEGASLAIYGQTAGTGALHVKNLEACGWLAICGGKVTADEAICAMGRSLDIIGGQVSAGTGIYAGDGNEPNMVFITLRRATDYVKAGSNGFKLGDYDASRVNITGTLNAFNSNGTYFGSVSGVKDGDADVFIGTTLRLDVWGMADGKDGTAEKPYKISTEAGLRALSLLSKDNNYYGTYFELGADIDMSDEPMKPIGTSDYGHFGGHFDGQGHTISNLHISEVVFDCVGLFALNNGEISGVTLAGCTVTGNEDGTQYTGGIVGYNVSGTVSGCHITGNSSVSTTGASIYLGGIVGDNEGMVSGCTSAATVSKTASKYEQHVGGIVGYNGGSGTVSDCGNTGGVAINATGSASYICGGIVGEIYSGTVSGCINTGAVSSSSSGSNFAGGIVGRAENNTSVTIENCANGGEVTASGGTRNCAGGIVGYYDDSNYVLTNNFYFGACMTKGAANHGGSFDITADNGAVAGYAVTADEGVTVAPAVKVATGVEDAFVTSGAYYGTGMTVTLGDYTGTVPEDKGLWGYTATKASGGSVGVSFAGGAYSFAMPAEAVTVAPDFRDCMTSVPYVGAGGATTTADGVPVWVLSGETTEQVHIGKAGETTWYVVTDSNTDGVDAAFLNSDWNPLLFHGDVHLILADGAVMQVGADEGLHIMYGNGTNMNYLTIYGQTAGTGTLSVPSIEGVIYNQAGDVTICSGKVTVGNFIWADLGDVTICGGTVTAGNEITSYDGKVAISGGTVTARGIYIRNNSSESSGVCVTISGGRVTAEAIYGYDHYNNDSPLPVYIALSDPTDYVYIGEYGFTGFQQACPVNITGELISIAGDGAYCNYVSGEELPGDGAIFRYRTLRLANFLDEDKSMAWYEVDGSAGSTVRLLPVLAADAEPSSALPSPLPALTASASAVLGSSNVKAILLSGSAEEQAVRSTTTASWTDAIKAKAYAAELTLFEAGATNTWATFCAAGDYVLPSGCTAYTLSGVSNGSVTVTPLMDGEQLATTVPACVPVMVRRADGDVTERLAATFSRAVNFADEWTEDKGWDIRRDEYNKFGGYGGYDEFYYNASKGGTYAGVFGGLIDNIEYNHYFYGNSGASGAAFENEINAFEVYTYLALYNDHLYKIEGDPGIQAHRGVVGIHKRLLTGGSSNARQLNIAIDNGETTGIVAIDNGQLTIDNYDDAWYTLDGRKVTGSPTRKGVYISGGRKVVVK